MFVQGCVSRASNASAHQQGRARFNWGRNWWREDRSCVWWPDVRYCIPAATWEKAWSEDPGDRPSPVEIVEDLKKIQVRNTCCIFLQYVAIACCMFCLKAKPTWFGRVGMTIAYLLLYILSIYCTGIIWMRPFDWTCLAANPESNWGHLWKVQVTQRITHPKFKLTEHNSLCLDGPSHMLQASFDQSRCCCAMWASWSPEERLSEASWSSDHFFCHNAAKDAASGVDKYSILVPFQALNSCSNKN